MKTYGIKPEEIAIADFKITGISLGEKGRARRLTIVPTPASGLMEPGVSKTGKPRLNPSKSEAGWLARISTEGAYIRGGRGSVSALPETRPHINVVALGNGAFGAAGGTGYWVDVLLACKLEEFVLRVKPTRGDAYILSFANGNVSRLTYAEAEALDIELGDSSPTSLGRFERIG